MLGDFISELRIQARDRVMNPLLGPFSFAWLLSNWKAVSVLLVSNNPIEQRIAFIENNYIDIVRLLIVPLGFAIFYALVLPGINFGVQKIQEGVNLKRRIHKLGIDTDFLIASVARAEAQAALNKILAKDQITQKQQDEINRLKGDLTELQNSAEASIAEKEAELEQKRTEYEQRNHNDAEEAERERREIETLRNQLQVDRDKAKNESERLRAELISKQKELERGLDKNGSLPFSSTNIDFESIILSKKYRLFHNPSIGPERSKPIKFEPDGKISEGNNNNEHSWRVISGKLELIQADGRVHSRFFYLPDSQIFVHTGDKDTRSKPGQYIIPEGSYAAAHKRA